jgi:SET domain-containing protein
MDTPVRRPRIDPKFAGFKMSIRKSKIHRYGVYAEERIPANRKVIEYTGERLNRRETKRRSEGDYTYLFTLDKYWTLDGAFGGSGAEIINHSCEPNVVSRIMKGHVIYMSLRTIEPGEEITVDYNFEYVGDQNSCSCGANTCRSVMERMTPKLERALAKQKAAQTESTNPTETGRAGANGKVESKPKSKAAHI